MGRLSMKQGLQETEHGEVSRDASGYSDLSHSCGIPRSQWQMVPSWIMEARGRRRSKESLVPSAE